VDVETNHVPSEEEKIVADVQAASSESRELDDESTSAELTTGETHSEPEAGGTPAESLPKDSDARSQARVPEVTVPRVEPRSVPTQTKHAKPSVAAPVPKPLETPDTPTRVQSEESKSTPKEVAQKEAETEEPVRSEVAERAFQILRAKSALANQLVEGGFTEYSFRDWKALERGATEVYVDLLVDSIPDDREVHFVWSVDVEAQSVRAMSQAARELQARDR
jgi:hypothetical protein